MNVQCLSCSSRYSVPDAKVQGRKVRIKCKKCSAPILIDGTHLGKALVQSNRPIVAESIPAPLPVPAPARAAAARPVAGPSHPAGSAPAAPRQAAPRPGLAPAPLAAPAPAAATGAKRQTMLGLPNNLGARTNAGASAPVPRVAQVNAPKAFQRTLLGGLGVATKETSARQAAPPPPTYPPAPWTVAVTEEDQRELTTDQVVALYAVGTIDEGTYVWREGMEDWCSPFEAPDLRRALQAARISPREPLDSDEDDDEDESFDQSDEPIVPSSPLADELDERRHPGMWHEPGRVGAGYDTAFEDVTVSMNEKETEGLLRKARRADFEDETTVARGSARLHSPFAEAAARGPGATRQVRSQTFEFDEEEVTQAISTSEARAPFARHDNASQRAFELSQRKHGGPAPQTPGALRASPQPVAQRSDERQESSTVFSLDALTQKSSSSAPPARTEMFPSSPPVFRQPPRPPVKKPPSSFPTAPMAQISSFPPNAPASSRPPVAAQGALDRAHYPSAPPIPEPAYPRAVERAYPSAPPASTLPLSAQAARLSSSAPPARLSSAPPSHLAVAPSRPSAPVLDDDSDVFEYPRPKRAKWLVVAAALVLVVGSAGASFGLRQPLPLWAKIHELSGGQFPAWPELRPAPSVEPPKAPVASPPEPRPAPAAAAAPTTSAEAAAAPAEPASESAHATRSKEPERGGRSSAPAAATEAAAAASASLPGSAADDTNAEELDYAPGTETLPEFDRSAAAEALGQAAASAATCKAADGPTGRGRATVTFANSGRATNANVTGTFAGTTVGGCVAELFRQARVPAFSGPPVKVAKSFTVE